MSWNFEYEVEIEVDSEPEYEVEYEVEEDYGPGYGHTIEYDYGGYGNDADVEIEIEYEQPHVDINMYGGMHPNQMHHTPHQHHNMSAGTTFKIQPNFNTNGWESWGRATPQNKQHWMAPWSGWYDQGGRNDMRFDNFQIDLQGNIWGHGADGQGHFNIAGKMNMMNKAFKFNKQYSHGVCVVYSGKAQGPYLAGQWVIPGNCQGTFQIKNNAPRWTGAYWQNGQQNNMHLDMTVDHFGVAGYGSDNVGCFVIRGQTQGNVVTFAKKYYGAHTVFYQGHWNGNKIQGMWQIPGNCSGKFQLHC